MTQMDHAREISLGVSVAGSPQRLGALLIRVMGEA
jgi:hypothetical protein